MRFHRPHMRWRNRDRESFHSSRQTHRAPYRRYDAKSCNRTTEIGGARAGILRASFNTAICARYSISMGRRYLHFERLRNPRLPPLPDPDRSSNANDVTSFKLDPGGFADEPSAPCDSPRHHCYRNAGEGSHSSDSPIVPSSCSP